VALAQPIRLLLQMQEREPLAVQGQQLVVQLPVPLD
jgi:hypothetical protein